MEALFEPQLVGLDAIIDGVHQMVADTIKRIPIDLSREMYGNIVISGGTSLCQGLQRRFM